MHVANEVHESPFIQVGLIKSLYYNRGGSFGGCLSCMFVYMFETTPMTTHLFSIVLL